MLGERLKALRLGNEPNAATDLADHLESPGPPIRIFENDRNEA